MKREQIMAVEGRELDAAVAEHVMGWRDIKVRMFPGALCTLGGNPPGKSWPDMVPDYSTDIAAAWRVVERLPWPVALTNVVDGEWECTVLCYDGGETHDNDETATARTAPEAICRAALLAHFTDVRSAKTGVAQSEPV